MYLLKGILKETKKSSIKKTLVSTSESSMSTFSKFSCLKYSLVDILNSHAWLFPCFHRPTNKSTATHREQIVWKW